MNQHFAYIAIKKYDQYRKYNRIFKGFLLSSRLSPDTNFIVWYPKVLRYKEMHVYKEEIIGKAGKIPKAGDSFIRAEIKKNHLNLDRQAGKLTLNGVTVGVIGGTPDGT